MLVLLLTLLPFSAACNILSASSHSSSRLVSFSASSSMSHTCDSSILCHFLRSSTIVLSNSCKKLLASVILPFPPSAMITNPSLLTFSSILTSFCLFSYSSHSSTSSSISAFIFSLLKLLLLRRLPCGPVSSSIQTFNKVLRYRHAFVQPPLFSLCSNCFSLTLTVTCHGFGVYSSGSSLLFLCGTGSTSICFLSRLGISSFQACFPVFSSSLQVAGRTPPSRAQCLVSCGQARASAFALVYFLLLPRPAALLPRCVGSCSSEFKRSGLLPLSSSAASKPSCSLLPSCSAPF